MVDSLLDKILPGQCHAQSVAPRAPARPGDSPATRTRCCAGQDCEAIFQSALQRRVWVPTDRTPERSANGLTNPLAPCAYARFPVAMLVQRIGESIGESDATFPITPPSMSRSRFGINPHRAADGSSASRPRPNRRAKRGDQATRSSGNYGKEKAAGATQLHLFASRASPRISDVKRG